jgi:hypothetical protein
MIVDCGGCAVARDDLAARTDDGTRHEAFQADGAALWRTDAGRRRTSLSLNVVSVSCEDLVRSWSSRRL